MSMGAVPYPIVPPLPDYENRKSTDVTSSGGGSSEKKQLGEEQKSALAAQQDVTQKQIAETDEVRKLKEQQGQVGEWQSQAQADQATIQMQQTEAAMRRADEIKQQAIQRTKDAQAKLDATPTPRLFADRSTAEKAMLGVGMLLGGFSDAVQKAAMIRIGHAPPTIDTVGDIINADLDRQRRNIERLKDNVVTTRMGIADADEARRQMLAEVDLRGAQAYKRIESLARARLASVGMKAPEIEQNQAILALKQKQADAQAEYVKPLYDTLQRHWDSATKTTNEDVNRVATAKPGGGGGVEADKNAANFGLLKEHADWLAQEMPKLTPDEVKSINAAQAGGGTLEKNGVLRAGAALAGVDAESGMTERAKEYLDRARRAQDALGRLKSGGAINDEENRNFAKMLTPQVSDSEKDRSMRSSNLSKDVSTMGAYLERPARNAPNSGQPSANAPAATAPAAAPAKPQSPERARAIELLKKNPGAPGAAAVMKRLGITPEDLR